MQRNKQKYNFFKNSKYAVDGLVCAFKTETSFKIEMFLALVLMATLFYIDIAIISKLILFTTYFLILIVELLNSAIENIVDLITNDIHPLAKNAKDIGATAVMFSIILHIICWIVIIL